MREPAKLREELPFPECSDGCVCVEYFGVCECEAICPWKFNEDGTPKKEVKPNAIHSKRLDSCG